jgi:Berberine and berberine like
MALNTRRQFVRQIALTSGALYSHRASRALPQRRLMRCIGFRPRATLCSRSRTECISTSWAIRVTSLSSRAMGQTMLASLSEIKKKYDPTNMLRLNQNITPDWDLESLRDLGTRRWGQLVGHSEAMRAYPVPCAALRREPNQFQAERQD